MSQMKYPYTLTAKIGQFPWKHHFTGHWLYKYYAFGIFATFPIYLWLNKQVNSPGNIQKYEEQMAKEAAAHGHH